MNRASVRIRSTMKGKRVFLHKILRIANLPQDMDPHRFYLQWYGVDSCAIERHKGILRFDETEIRMLTEQGVLVVSGERLTLENLSESAAQISGKIDALSVERKS